MKEQTLWRLFFFRFATRFYKISAVYFETCPRMSHYSSGIMRPVERRGDMQNKVLNKTEILFNLSLIAKDDAVAPNYRIKALEL